jgi:urease accessory protein
MSLASRLEAAYVGGRSRLVSCRSVAPLKLINPASGPAYCAAILSGYGGGVVQGDQVELEVECGASAAMFIGTQSFTKVYKSPRGLLSSQRLKGRVAAGGLVAMLPDPVVPYADSAFTQEQHWHLQGDAILLVADGHTAGRAGRDPRFSYRHYASHIEVERGGKPLLVERYESVPGQLAPTGVGAFGRFDASLNIFALGAVSCQRWHVLAEALDIGFQGLSSAQSAAPPDLLFSHDSPEPGILALRALGRNAEALEQ